ncbi:Hypothetical predicted protein [Octopus vulgaris]|uniref:Uncharacterized protein n=1 Tax=Octopus vulgaris TaxID=6645 RepID=A0AA36BW07_OCTVU|nr:Hypothetical predicted protein [Octopus vulgaris]
MDQGGYPYPVEGRSEEQSALTDGNGTANKGQGQDCTGPSRDQWSCVVPHGRGGRKAENDTFNTWGSGVPTIQEKGVCYHTLKDIGNAEDTKTQLDNQRMAVDKSQLFGRFKTKFNRIPLQLLQHIDRARLSLDQDFRLKLKSNLNHYGRP